MRIALRGLWSALFREKGEWLDGPVGGARSQDVSKVE